MKYNSYNTHDLETRNKAIHSNENTLILASAGTGKTKLLVDKLIYEQDHNVSYQTFAALTFTTKAAKEIKERVKFSNRYLFIGTIDGFLEKEIIEPFISLYLKTECTLFYSYTNNNKFTSYSDGIQQIIDKNIVGTYKESSKNFKCELSLKILKEVIYSREYLKFKYKKIFIDEYQDCDFTMHSLFQYLNTQLAIKMFIVGDPKQAIYQFRGANPRYLEDLIKKDDYLKLQLNNNFRSKQDIIDFSQAISPEIEVENLVNSKSIFYYASNPSESKANIIKFLIEESIIDLSSKTFLILGNNNDIYKLHKELNTIYPREFEIVNKTNITNCINKTILESIAKYYFDSEFSEYDFIENLYLEYDNILIADIKNILLKIKNEASIENIEELFDKLKIPVREFEGKLESELLQTILKNDINKTLYNMQTNSKLLLTTHASKGLEASTVILFTSYFFHYESFNVENNYVAITRAKNKLILIDDNNCRYKKRMNMLLEENQYNKFSFDDFVTDISNAIQ
ncbi:ATP-dependent helicase [Staphylococcus saprophyticus]|uniref:UvrD-helicase domain-containing protein n=1 Tax=Staphylococcus saprophyticus TaxID=29385 RepID=UPI00188701A9|nr:UvrD-helicase domain-containing protein [Staphylococcus saprophyticus]MBF2782716.1 ATP-dependent helicase [Staphylococcus saprophyticus]MDW4107912.1 UvrD-helicase domain-containing protein [Staphylococcus saprophyticus]